MTFRVNLWIYPNVNSSVNPKVFLRVNPKFNSRVKLIVNIECGPVQPSLLFFHFHPFAFKKITAKFCVNMKFYNTQLFSDYVVAIPA